ncbi:MAG: gluconokinase [Candidatus Devosia symbiotica]|nr:gluconokinase [Candidatus Devosia symbiotica]
MTHAPARIIIVMNISSSGKSTVGQSIARRLYVPFFDGDSYHPTANVEKMRAGILPTDEDRCPWLERMTRRQHEYMPISLLDSQFATLEAPDPHSENVLVVPIADSVEKLIQTMTKPLTHFKSFKRWQ